MMYFSGSDESDPYHRHGTAIIVDNTIKNCVISFTPLSNRVILLQLKTQIGKANIIQLYAPTADKDDNELESFYREVDTLLKQVKKHELCIVMGDMNAKIGKGRFEDVVGEYGLGERNDRGDRLLQFPQENELVITNTLFKLPERRLYTWKSPQDSGDHVIRNQIDYIMIKKRYRNSILAAKNISRC
ncbi:hypothetical protein RN001_015234 [Aquatica leii]|uniref:Endonuclease/exonuclease/phosphatase domain-containing protein n=1 Tax=Aquatica leii TaxID=1421715 RepID=A0AAN7NVE3_9COLE|nr:hypothetical protein RN001_015234 [Aquatica leii]